MELAAQDVAHMTDSEPAPVYNIHNKSGTGKHSTNSSHPATVECYRCGGNHYATKCRFMEATCRTCGKKGHLARVCRSSAKGSFQTSKKPQSGKSSPPQSTTCPNPNSKPQFPTHSLHEEPHLLAPASPVSDYPLFTFPSNAKPIVVTVQVNNVDLPMELDTGVSLSLISEATYKSLLPALPPLSPTSVVLTTYTGEKIPPLGSIDVTVVYRSQESRLPLLVVAGGNQVSLAETG